MGSAWFSRRAVLLHLTMIMLVVAMIGLTWWQASRALSGNTLSYVYAFEWPLLAGVVVYMWWDLLHDRPDRQRRGQASRPSTTNGTTPGAGPAEPNQSVPRYREEEDEELAAYNRYLAELSASGRRKTWRHPT